MSIKDDALDLIKVFQASDRHPAFRHANRAVVAEEMRLRVIMPYLINQGHWAGCGPAALAMELVRTAPTLYVGAIQTLFDWGYALVHKWELKPSDDLKNSEMPTGPDAYVPQSDWILLASIRDSENWFFWNHISAKANDSDRADTQFHELKDWYGEIGFKNVEAAKIGADVSDKTINLKRSLELNGKGWHVSWYVQAAAVHGIMLKSIEANHWVVLPGDCDFTPPGNKSDNVSIPVFTWGKYTKIPEAGVLTYGQFLDNYFGYIAGSDFK
jgi:hypothetical protein